MKSKNLALNILITCLATLFALFAAELLLALLHPIEHLRPSGARPDDNWRQLLHRPSSIPGLAYELVPNQEKRAVGAMITTNSHGMRDAEPWADHPALYRIAVLGDSFTFGFRVAGETTYPAVLEDLLNRASSEARFDVLNFGVGGYSTHDEALVLTHKASTWNPALIILGYYFNDPETEPLQPLHRHYHQPAWWQHFNLTRLVAWGWRRWEEIYHGGGDYYRFLHAPETEHWQSVLRAFAQIQRTANGLEAPVLVVIFPVTQDRPWADYPYRDLHRQVADAARAHGFHVLDLLGPFAERPGQELMARSWDNHPSVTGHAVAARAIQRWIVANRAIVVARPTDRQENLVPYYP